MSISTNKNRLLFQLLQFHKLSSALNNVLKPRYRYYKEIEQDIKLSRRREHNNENEGHQPSYLSLNVNEPSEQN